MSLDSIRDQLDEISRFLSIYVKRIVFRQEQKRLGVLKWIHHLRGL